MVMAWGRAIASGLPRVASSYGTEPGLRRGLKTFEEVGHLLFDLIEVQILYPLLELA